MSCSLFLLLSPVGEITSALEDDTFFPHDHLYESITQYRVAETTPFSDQKKVMTLCCSLPVIVELEAWKVHWLLAAVACCYYPSCLNLQTDIGHLSLALSGQNVRDGLKRSEGSGPCFL